MQSLITFWNIIERLKQLPRYSSCLGSRRPCMPAWTNQASHSHVSYKFGCPAVSSLFTVHPRFYQWIWKSHFLIRMMMTKGGCQVLPSTSGPVQYFIHINLKQMTFRWASTQGEVPHLSPIQHYIPFNRQTITLIRLILLSWGTCYPLRTILKICLYRVLNRIYFLVGTICSKTICIV